MPDVSIIISSYNIYYQTLFTLESLSNQTFDLSKVEVILIDNGSTDNTYKLKDFKSTFQFKYIRCKENLERAGAKNKGLEHAEGSIIIFLNGEMLVEKDFISKHVSYHLINKNIIVSTNFSQQEIFTVYHPDFNENQMRKFYEQKQKYVSHDILSKETQSITELITRDEIISNNFNSYSYNSPYFTEVYKNYGFNLKQFLLPWVICVTRCISIRKDLIEKAGYFDECFKGWGSEDSEWAYRMYKKGAIFVEAPEIKVYHQEHPFNEQERSLETIQNLIKLQTIHKEIDTAILSLGFFQRFDLILLNNILREYITLTYIYKTEFNIILEYLYESLIIAPKIHMKNTSLKKGSLNKQVSLELKHYNRNELLKQYKALNALNDYPLLTKLIKYIIK